VGLHEPTGTARPRPIGVAQVEARLAGRRTGVVPDRAGSDRSNAVTGLDRRWDEDDHRADRSVDGLRGRSTSTDRHRLAAVQSRRPRVLGRRFKTGRSEPARTG
jgi:hypothetical protein